MLHSLPAVLPIVGGLLLGSFLGGIVFNSDPALAGWLFGAGIGLTGGAFLAALATNEPIVGKGNVTRRPQSYPGEEIGPRED